MAEIRCYVLIDAAATRGASTWNAMLNAVKAKPMIQLLRDKASTRNQPHNQVNLDRGSINPVRRYVIGDFEIDTNDVAVCAATLDSECQRRLILASGTQAKLQALIQAEIQEAAVDLGFVAIAPLITVTVIGFGLRQNAIDDALAYVSANRAIWEDVA